MNERQIILIMFDDKVYVENIFIIKLVEKKGN